MVDVRDDYPRFQAAGGDVAVIAMAEQADAAAFHARYALPFPILSDPRSEAYRAFGLQRGNTWKIAGPAVWFAGLKSILRHGVSMPVTDPFQLAGTFVIDRAGIIRYSHHAANSADRPPNADLIEAIQAST